MDSSSSLQDLVPVFKCLLIPYNIDDSVKFESLLMSLNKVPSIDMILNSTAAANFEALAMHP